MATDKSNGLLKTIQLIQKQLLGMENEISDYRSPELYQTYEEVFSKMVKLSKQLKEHLR